MKHLFIILSLALFSCSSDDTQKEQPQPTCYKIISRGLDSRGNYIIINYSSYGQKRYEVNNYLDYLGQNEICEPINLTEQAL